MSNLNIFQCVSDCITFKIGANKYEDGNVDYETFEKHFNKLPIDDMWKPMVQTAVKDCFMSTTDKAEDLKISFALHPAFTGEKICHPFSGVLISCISAHLLNNCPSQLWQPCKFWH